MAHIGCNKEKLSYVRFYHPQPKCKGNFNKILNEKLNDIAFQIHEYKTLETFNEINEKEIKKTIRWVFDTHKYPIDKVLFDKKTLKEFSFYINTILNDKIYITVRASEGFFGMERTVLFYIE